MSSCEGLIPFSVRALPWAGTETSAVRNHRYGLREVFPVNLRPTEKDSSLVFQAVTQRSGFGQVVEDAVVVLAPVAELSHDLKARLLDECLDQRQIA